MEKKRLSGILAHPTSLPSPFGIGDLGGGAYDFVDFLRKSGQSLWQILPLSPTGYGDSPYQSCSAFACNTLLISPEVMAEDGLLSECDLSAVPAFDGAAVDYTLVIDYKTGIYKAAFNRFMENKEKKENKTKALYKDYACFCEKHKDWLCDYALFVSAKNHFIQERKNAFEPVELNGYRIENAKYMKENTIKDYFYGAVWPSWPKRLMKREPAAIKEYSELLAGEIEYHKFLQFIFFRQWDKLKTYANKRGVRIIGDIPIFVAYDSADAWVNSELLMMEDGRPTGVAGVPPDYFSETGQLWGNPLYDWKKHEAQDFAWWTWRIRHALELVDILRIDHFRGFESYWNVPYGEETAINGKWNKAPGKKLFAAIKKQLGEAPIIAEDLGIITEAVNELREHCGFPGMKVLQFAFEGDASSPHLPHNYKNSGAVVYTGTHDNDTTVGWYGAASDKTRDFFRRYMDTDGKNPSWDLIRLAFMSCADIAVTPVQDVLSLGAESRMNAPGKTENCWRFRFDGHRLDDSTAERLAYLSRLSGRNTDLPDIPQDNHVRFINRQNAQDLEGAALKLPQGTLSLDPFF